MSSSDNILRRVAITPLEPTHLFKNNALPRLLNCLVIKKLFYKVVFKLEPQNYACVSFQSYSAPIGLTVMWTVLS